MHRLSKSFFSLALSLVFLFLFASDAALALQAFALKVNPNGEQVWYQGLQEKMIASPDDSGMGPEIELDEENNVYLMAFLFVAQFTKDGQVGWHFSVRAASNLLTIHNNILFEDYIDVSHLIYLFDSNNQMVWSLLLEEFIIFDLDINKQDALLASGLDYNEDNQYTIYSIDLTGNIIWRHIQPVSKFINMAAIFLKSSNNGFYVAGFCRDNTIDADVNSACLAFHNDEGDQQFILNVMPEEVKSLAIDADGNALLAGADIYDISPAGEVLWSFEVGGVVYDMQVDTDGSIYALSQPGDSRVMLTKLDADGGFLWQEQYRGEHIRARTLRLDADGNAYIVGTSCNDTGEWYTDCRALAIKYSSEGEPLWAHTYQGVDGYDCYAYDAEVDDSGNLYLSGYSHDSKDDSGGGNSLGCGCL